MFPLHPAVSKHAKEQAKQARFSDFFGVVWFCHGIPYKYGNNGSAQMLACVCARAGGVAEYKRLINMHLRGHAKDKADWELHALLCVCGAFIYLFAAAQRVGPSAAYSPFELWRQWHNNIYSLCSRWDN